MISIKNQTEIDINIKNIQIFYKLNIIRNIEINNISTDFYRIIAVENLDQKNNIIIYKNKLYSICIFWELYLL